MFQTRTFSASSLDAESRPSRGRLSFSNPEKLPGNSIDISEIKFILKAKSIIVKASSPPSVRAVVAPEAAFLYCTRLNGEELVYLAIPAKR